MGTSVESFLALSTARLAPRTVEAYRRDLVDFCAWLDGAPDGATPDQIAEYVASMRAAGLAATTIARRVAALRVVLPPPGAARGAQRQSRRGARPAAAQAHAAAHAVARRGRAADRRRVGNDAALAARPGARRAALRRRPARQRGGRARANGVDLEQRVVRCIGKGSKERVVPVGRRSRRGATPLPRPRPPLPRRPAPAGALPERARRRADPRRRLPHPAPARRDGGPRAGPGPPPSAAPLLRDPPAGGRGRPALRAGDAGPRRSGHHRALHPRIRSAPSASCISKRTPTPRKKS